VPGVKRRLKILVGSPAEAQMLEQENERLMEQLNSLTNAVDQVRSPMVFAEIKWMRIR
jgi:hypothetical protein